MRVTCSFSVVSFQHVVFLTYINKSTDKVMLKNKQTNINIYDNINGKMIYHRKY